jgi:hypothetical protein
VAKLDEAPKVTDDGTPPDQKDAKKKKKPAVETDVVVGSAYQTYKRTIEIADLVTSMLLLNTLYYAGMGQADNTGINSYKIATVTMFISIFAPFWIAYSALLKIALMQDRYEPTYVAKKGICQKFFLLLFLTCLGTILLMLSKIIQAIGEILALCMILTCSGKRVSRVRGCFDYMCSYILIDIDKYTYDGVMQLQYNSLMFFQDVPLLILQIFIFFDILSCPELLEDSFTFVLSFGSTILNICSFFLLKKFDQNATGESFILLSLEGMTAQISWLPHLAKIKDTSEDTLSIDYGEMKTSIPIITSLFGIYYEVEFQFNDITVKSFIDAVTRRTSEIDTTDIDTTKQRKIRLNISACCDNIAINELLHIVNLVPTKIVEIIIDGCNIPKMIKSAKAKRQVFESSEAPGKFDGYTPSGVPLLFSCIDKEPENQNLPWIFEGTMGELLKQGFNPNQINQLTR